MLSITALLALAHATAVLATTSCSSSSQCPESAPCCSQYGVCGTGANCLGGCNPHYSFKPEACMPMPVCKDVNTTFGTQAFPNLEEYLGNPDDTDWIYTGYTVNSTDDDALLITMPEDSGGTVLSSSRYMLYGKYGATLKTSRGNGVVSAFISYSDSMDEIDWEWVGYQLEISESNYYHQGVLNWNNYKYIDTSDTFENYHLYEVDWQEDAITWYIDGEAQRTLKKSDTYNSTTGTYAYPETPMRVQFSLWSVTSASGVGTQEWAGGVVDWDSEDMQNEGYYYVTIKDAYIQCADAPSAVKKTGSTAYVYNSTEEYNLSSVMITDDNTVLCSQDNSGLDDNDGCAVSEKSSSEESSSSSEKSSSSSSSEASSSSDVSSSSEISSSSSAEISSSSEASSSEASSTSEVSSSSVEASSEASSAVATTKRAASTTSAEASTTSLAAESTTVSTSMEASSSATVSSATDNAAATIAASALGLLALLAL